METKQISAEFVNGQTERENIIRAKDDFRFQQRNLSFNEKMRIAFSLNERDIQLKKAKNK